MSFRTRRVLFATPFYMILSYVLLRYLTMIFGGINEVYLISTVIFLGFIQSVPMLFEEKKSRKITRILSTISGVWTWFLVMLLIYLVAIYIAELFITIPKEIIALVLITIPIIGVYAYQNAHKIVIHEHTITFDNLEEEYNIIHLSDVHFGSVRYKEILDDIAQNIKKLENECDLVIISGDLADGSCIVEEDDFIALKQINVPILFTSGNHDYYPGLESVHNACKKAGMIILENEGMEYKDLNIYGLSFSFDDITMPTEDELRQFIKEDKINILNYHVPNGWQQIAELGFDLQLSGHTHGGQFYPIVNIGNLMYEGHNMGLFKENFDGSDCYLHVTTGVGSMDIPMRWGTNSEMVLLKIRKS